MIYKYKIKNRKLCKVDYKNLFCRALIFTANVVSVSIIGSDLISYSRLKKLTISTDSKRKIYEVSCYLFDNHKKD